jgi:hypothetical protein
MSDKIKSLLKSVKKNAAIAFCHYAYALHAEIANKAGHGVYMQAMDLFDEMSESDANFGEIAYGFWRVIASDAVFGSDLSNKLDSMVLQAVIA